MSLKLKTIGIIVKDMGRTLAFYRALGFSIPEGVENEGNVDFEAPNGITLGFLSEEVAKQADPRFIEPVGQSLNLQFMLDSASEVDQLYKKLIDLGFTSYSEPWDAFWGQRFGRVLDPDGRIVNFYAELH